MTGYDPLEAIPTGMRIKRGTLILAALALTPIIFLAACGGGQDESPTATPEPAPTEEPADSQGSASSQSADPTSTPTVAEETEPTSEPTQTESASITVTDIAGREVTVEAPVERIILGEGRQLYILAMLDPENPFKRVVGWRNDVIQYDPDTYEKYEAKFPEAADIPILGRPGTGEFSVEQALTLEPDLVVLTLEDYQGVQETGLIEKLEEAGIPTVVVDYRLHALENTVPSVRLLGELLGKEDNAQAFADYYRQQLNEVYSRIEGVEGPKPEVFLYRAAGFSGCCATFGDANLGLFIERLGGINLGSELVPGWEGTVNPEEVVDADVDMIIVTGANWAKALPEGGYVSFGYSTAADTSQEQLQQAVERQGWEILQAAKNGQVYGIWHQFYGSPYHFVALQRFAKWLYPEQFEDLDPEEIYREFHERFLPIEYSGTFWVSIDELSGDSAQSGDPDAASRRANAAASFSQVRLIHG